MKSLISFTLLSGFVAVALLFTSCGGSSGGSRDSMTEAPSSLEKARLLGELEIVGDDEVKYKDFSFNSGSVTFARVENGVSTTFSGPYTYEKKNTTTGSLIINVYDGVSGVYSGKSVEINIEQLEFDVNSHTADYNNVPVTATGTLTETTVDSVDSDSQTSTESTVKGTFTYVSYSGVNG
jgi:hypothetical protein